MSALALAMALDAALGEPRWLWDRVPHPAVLIGRAIGWADRRWNCGDARKAKGVALMLGLALAALALGHLLRAIPGQLAEVIVLAILLAQRSLVDHVRAVADALRLSLGDGRLAVSNIVGRDTAAMDESAVARSAIESAAENLSDGVVAPVVWFAVAGLPGLLLYKVTNTADSMIGYKTPRHADFGWAAARFDDLLNLVPARLTAGVIWLLSGPRRPFADIAADARTHRSPNAGWPEAAMARALDVALSGPRSYDGEMRDFDYIHAKGRKAIGPDAIEAATTKLWQVWGVLLGLAVVASLF